jgi:hypothetical protein
MAKTRPDSFSGFLKTPRRKSRVCETCRNPKWKSLIKRWAKLERRRTICPSRQQLFEELQKHHKYPLSYSGMNLHLTRCLGLRNAR